MYRNLYWQSYYTLQKDVTAPKKANDGVENEEILSNQEPIFTDTLPEPA